MQCGRPQRRGRRGEGGLELGCGTPSSQSHLLMSKLGRDILLSLGTQAIQGAVYGCGLSFVDTFVKCSSGWWTVPVAAPEAHLVGGSFQLDVNKKESTLKEG